MTGNGPNSGIEILNPKLHHIALVVADIDAAVARYHLLGFAGDERFLLDEQAVEVVTLRSGSGWIELIRPTDSGGAIARFMARRGEGFHHVAYAVSDLGAALENLEAAGAGLIDRAPRIGVHGWRIAFIHPETCGGVLTELVQEDV